MIELKIENNLILGDYLENDFDLYINWKSVNPNLERRKKEIIYSHFNRLKDLVLELVNEKDNTIIPEYINIRGL